MKPNLSPPKIDVLTLMCWQLLAAVVDGFNDQRAEDQRASEVELPRDVVGRDLDQLLFRKSNPEAADGRSGTKKYLMLTFGDDRFKS